MNQTFIYGVFEIKGGKFNQSESSIVNIAFDNFTSSLRIMRTRTTFPEVEFLGETYNNYIQELGGGVSERNNYWIVRDNSGVISIKKDSGTGVTIENVKFGIGKKF